MGDGDFFWEANGRAQFPKMAEDVDVQLNKYKAAVEELNRKTGANVDANMDPNELMQVVAGSVPAAMRLPSSSSLCSGQVHGSYRSYEVDVKL